MGVGHRFLQSHRRTGTGYHVACVLNLSKKNKNREDDTSCKQGLMPLSFTIQCQPTALKMWYAFQETTFWIKGFPRLDQLRKEYSKTLGRWSKANNQAARDRLRRETSSTLTSEVKEFHKMHLKTKKNDQDSRIGEQAQNGAPNRICHCRLE